MVTVYASFIRKFLAAFFLFSILTTTVKAQTTLVAGDIAFSGYTSNTVAGDEFSFVLLKAVTSGTVINFTDNGWLSTNVFRTGETTVTWTSTAAMAAGTEIKINGTTATLVGGGAGGTVTGTALSLSTLGDQVLAYQGTAATPTFISAINMNVFVNGVDPFGVSTTAAAWDGTANSVSGSALPPGLTTGVNAIWIGTQDVSASEFDNSHFTGCALNLSTAALARAELNNQANWTSDNSTPPGFTLPTGCSYIVGVPAPTFTINPNNGSVCLGFSTSFTVAATNATDYQWQVDNGGGFVDIADDAIYSGSATTTLTVTAAPLSFNANQYRCVASNGSGSANSSAATFSVIDLPAAPTLLAKTPAAATVADGTPVSATFNAGSGGTGCSDDFRFTTNGGASYLPYTPGSNISTTGLAAGTGVVTIEGRRANCSAGCVGVYTALASWVVTPLPAGATTLNAGDLAFSSYASANDEFSFVLLRNIGPGTSVSFTNNGWLSTNVFRTGEETVTWTSNAAYGAGTEIKISGLTATLVSGGSAGTVAGTPLSLNGTGDQILAYRGSAAAPTFISAIHMNVNSTLAGDAVSTTAAAWDGTANNVSSSALPTGLTTGTNAIWIGTLNVVASEFDNARYGNCSNPATGGSISALRAALNNQVNWIKNNNVGTPGFVIPTGCNYLQQVTGPNITGQPANTAVCELSNANFTITATGATTYQWQVDPGSGFVNIIDDAIYSGATTATLNITAAPFSINNTQYRCIVTNGTGSATSNGASLTLTPLANAPTLLAKTPGSTSVADGTNVSATFNPGSGGATCVDDFRYTTDGGATYLPYTPGANISTTGLAAGSGWVFIEGRRAGCSGILACDAAYRVLASWYVTPLPAAATTLNAGDIAFSSYASSTDEFSFVLLKNVGAGTAINFTNNGWLSTNVFRTGEETILWTAPAGGLPAGTEIKIAGLTASKSGGGAAGTVAGTALSLNATGDQILAYRGSAAAPTFISAIHMNVLVNGVDPFGISTTAAAWDGAANSASASALPTGLVTGTNAIWIGTQGVSASEFDNAAYGNCAGPGTLGSLTGLRAALNNQANWTRNNNVTPGFAVPTGCNYLSILAPSINVNGTPLTAFSSCAGSASAEQNFVVSGSALTANIIITAPAGFEISTTSGSGFTTTLNLAPSGGGVPNTTIYVRLAASATGTPSGNITLASTGVTTINVAVSGTVNPVPPTPTITPGGPTTFCSGGSVTLTSSSATGNLWSTGETTQSIIVTTAGTYTVTVTTGGCTSSPSAGTTVTVNPLPDVNQPTNQTLCNDGTTTNVIFSGSLPGTTFNWTNNTPSIGLAASGTGNIPSFTATNATGAPVTATITVTPVTAGTPGGSFAYIANNVDGTVSVIDVTTNSVVATIPVGSNPEAVAASPDGSKVYVTRPGANVISTISTATNTVLGTAPAGTNPTGVVVNPNGNTVYASNFGGTNVTFYTPAGPTFNTVTVGADPRGIAVSPDGSTLYVANQNNAGSANSGSVSVINTATATVTATIPLDAYTTGVAVSPDGSKLYVTSQGTSKLNVINTATNALITTVGVGGPPLGVAVTPDGSRIYVAKQTTNVAVIDAATNTLITNITIPTQCYAVSISADGSKVFVTNPSANTVTVISTATNTVTATIPVGTNPTSLGNFIANIAATGCSGTAKTFNITVNPTPTATATPASQARCSGASIQPIVISGNVSGTTFNWTRDQVGVIGGSISPNGSGNITGTLVNNTGSPVTVTFTITPTANGCPGTPITATVTVNPLPLATIIGGSQSAVCQGNNHTLSAVTNPGYTYAWGYSLFTNPFSPLGTDSVQDAEKSGTYLLTVTNQYGCTDTAMTYSNVADYEFVGSLATGDAVQTGRLNRFAQISTCGAPKSCPLTFTTVGSRLYDSYTITNPRNVPVCATIGVNSQCGTATFSAAYLGSFNPTNLCANYLADPGSSFTLSGFYEATIPANGTIVVVIHEVNPGTGCSSYRLSVAVPRDSLGIIVTPDSSICSSQTATLTAPVANSYSWSPGGATTRSITTTTPGLYTVNLGYGNHGCNISTSKTIIVTPAPTVNTINNQMECLGSTVNIPFTGSVPGTTYSWTNTNTAIGLGASGTGDLNFVATNATAAPISGTITVTPTNGSCTGSSKTFTITVLQQPNITSVTNDSVCAPGGVVNLSASGNGIINWYDSATGGHLVNTGTTYSPNITATTSFFVESVVYGAPPSLLAMPAQSNTFPGNVRGYWFTAPNDFVITSLSIPTTASTGPQNIAVLKFNNNTPPPVFSGTTNAFTTLYLTRLNTTTGKIPVNIPVHQGEVIGIMGERGGINSYAPGDYVTTINGAPVQLERLGMQFPLETFNPQNVWREFGATTSISRIEFEYAPASCPSSPRVEVKGVIKPLPIPTATPSSQTICSGSAITTIVLAPGTAAPTTYSWTRDNTGTVTGIAASGTTDISGTLTNTTNAPVTVTFTITASAVGGCTSAPITATVVVNPTSTVNAVSNQVVCNGGSTAAVTFSSPTTGGSIVYNWTNNTPSIGLAGSGTGNIGSFVAANATNAPVTATITVTPSFTNNSVTCVGTPRTFTITVNPTATVNTVSNQVVCNGGSTAAVTFTSPTTGGSIVYNWTNNTPSIGLAGSGTGNIGSFVGTNVTSAPVTATITVTPSYTNGAVTCVGTPSTFTITVNPTATVNTVSNQVVCNGANTTAVNFSSPTTGGSIVYNWTNNTPSIGLVGSGTGNIGSFVAANATNAPVTATITVTPSYTNGGVTCVGTPTTFTITVNPTAVVNAVANQVVCNGGSTVAVTFTSPTSGGSIVYNWTNNTTSIGLAGSGTGNIGSFVGTNATNAPVTATITVTASYTNGGVTCVGTPTTFTITVNPVAKVNTVSNQVLCNGSNTAAVNFTSPTTGGTITYNWTNNIIAIGLGASGSGNIPSFLATNNGVTPLVATITVTPAITNGGITCYGTPSSFTITVNPTPNVNAVPSQVLCNGSGTAAVNFTGAVAGTVYSWTNNNTSIGLVASGTGDISSFTATNATNAPVTATITVTPSYTNAGSTCTGAPISFTITVNPTPTVNAVSNQTVCNGSGTTAVTFSGAVAGTVYNWTNNTPSIGLAPGGTGNIGSFTAVNSGTTPITATITVTPSYTNGGTTCTGTPATFTITVNPTPLVVAVNNQTVCNGSATAAVNFTGNVAGTVFNWTNNTPSIGLIASGTGNIASFTAVNTGTTPVTATITVTPSYTNGGTTCTGTPRTFTITVNPSTVISANPANVTICEGNNASFTVAATGVGLTYQWQVNTGAGFNNIPGATLATYTITGAPALMNGYQYRCVVTGTCGTATSTAATLTVNTAPVVTANPVNLTVCAGNNASFSVTATGTNITYQWQVDNGTGFANIGGATNATLTLTGVTAAQNGFKYRCVVSGTCPPTATSTAATLTVNIPVSFTTQPANVSICFGLNASFSVVATGTGPLSYQWQVNSGSGFVNIPGEVSPTLSLVLPQIGFSLNQYRCVVTGACGPVNSNAGTLIVFSLPNIFANNPTRVCLSDTIVTLKATPVGGTWSGRGVTGDKFSATAAGLGVSSLTYTYVNANGCISIFNHNITVNDCKERHNRIEDAIKILPNPNNGQFRIQFLSDLYNEVNVRIVTVGGKQLGSTRYSGLLYGSLIPIDLRNLPAATYILQVYNGSDIGNFRIVIVH